MFKIFFYIILMLLFLSFKSYGYEIDADAVLNNLSEEFLNTAKEAAAPIKNAALRLFWILVPISLFFCGFKHLFKDGDIQAFFYDFVKIVLFTGIYLFLLDNGNEIGVSIIDSLSSLTTSTKTGPSELLDNTFNIVSTLNYCISEYTSGLVTSIILRCLVLLFALVMFWVVLSYTSVFLTAYITCICGVFVLGFGALHYTRDIATNYLKTVISLALELMTMIIICNSGCSLLSKIQIKAQELSNNGQALGLNECLVILFTSFFLLVLNRNLPKIVGQLIVGGLYKGTNNLAKLNIFKTNLGNN